ncbi:unnamed protein product [Thelazia callipaeda]|uniref:Fibronectin type-III domain-containing protein n=1 Tax=Thelazia callipaeda TaxID=103827 RepID=A0A0N5CZU9_THECL|nr:unnamed protein product [Thelazia callipaeda]
MIQKECVNISLPVIAFHFDKIVVAESVVSVLWMSSEISASSNSSAESLYDNRWANFTKLELLNESSCMEGTSVYTLRSLHNESTENDNTMEDSYDPFSYSHTQSFNAGKMESPHVDDINNSSNETTNSIQQDIKGINDSKESYHTTSTDQLSHKETKHIEDISSHPCCASRVLPQKGENLDIFLYNVLDQQHTPQLAASKSGINDSTQIDTADTSDDDTQKKQGNDTVKITHSEYYVLRMENNPKPSIEQTTSVYLYKCADPFHAT